MPCRLTIACCCCLVLVQAEARLAQAPADATELTSPSPQHPLQAQERRPREPGPATLREAVEIAIERYGGRETRAETVERDGRRVHEIRLLLDDGSVRTVRVNPDTGAILPPPER
jgi:uncharacterized membrane protein YkoI